MQLGGGKKKRVASFRANKKFSLFFLFPIYQTRLLLPVALADLPPSHTQSKRISRCTVGWHSVVNIFPLKIMPGLQFVIGCITRYSERAFSACVGGLLRRNCQFNTFSSLRANNRQNISTTAEITTKLHFLFHENKAELQIPTVDRRMGGRNSQGPYT